MGKTGRQESGGDAWERQEVENGVSLVVALPLPPPQKRFAPPSRLLRRAASLL